MRDVRDYKYAAGDSDHLSTSSPFNIKVQSFTLRNFNLAEVTRLYAQHTEVTGQIFTEEMGFPVVPKVFRSRWG